MPNNAIRKTYVTLQYVRTGAKYHNAPDNELEKCLVPARTALLRSTVAQLAKLMDVSDLLEHPKYVIEFLPEVAQLTIFTLLVLTVLTLRSISKQIAHQSLQSHLPALVPLLKDRYFVLQQLQLLRALKQSRHFGLLMAQRIKLIATAAYRSLLLRTGDAKYLTFSVSVFTLASR